jgi:hypothetical protein
VATAASCSTGGSCLCCSAMADLLQNDLNHLTGKKRTNLYMKAGHTIDKPARAGRATQIAAMVITGLVALIWVYFGRLYLIHDPGEWRIANQHSDTRAISSL